MFQHGFVPQELPVDFPRAIRRVLLTMHPSSEQRLINVAVQSVMVSLASQELMFLAMVLHQRRDLLVEDALRREQVVSAQFLWFQISTFDKLRFPRSLILT